MTIFRPFSAEQADHNVLDLDDISARTHTKYIERNTLVKGFEGVVVVDGAVTVELVGGSREGAGTVLSGVSVSVEE